MLRKLISLMTCLILVFALCASAAAAERKIIMRIGAIPVPPQPQSMAAEEFKRIVESKVGDRLDVQVFHALQLGSIAQHLQGMQNGSIHGIFFPNGFYGPIVPEIMVLDLAFFFPNAEWVYQMFNKGYMEPLQKAMEAKGLLLFAIPPAPDREIFLTQKLESLSDFRGKRIRTFSSPISQQSIAAMGFTPVNLDSSEVPVAIQQGTIDGIEVDITFWYSQKLFKSQYSLDFYKGSICHTATISKRWYDTLPADIQKAIREAAIEMAPIVHSHMNNVLLSGIAADPEAKLERLPISDSMIAEIRARVMPVHDVYKNMSPTCLATYNYYKELIEKFPNGDAPPLNK